MKKWLAEGRPVESGRNEPAAAGCFWLIIFTKAGGLIEQRRLPERPTLIVPWPKAPQVRA